MHNLALKERSLVVISIRVYPCINLWRLLKRSDCDHLARDVLEESISGIFHKDM